MFSYHYVNNELQSLEEIFLQCQRFVISIVYAWWEICRKTNVSPTFITGNLGEQGKWRKDVVGARWLKLSVKLHFHIVWDLNGFGWRIPYSRICFMVVFKNFTIKKIWLKWMYYRRIFDSLYCGDVRLLPTSLEDQFLQRWSSDRRVFIGRTVWMTGKSIFPWMNGALNKVLT